jgi:hypothetical protein
MLIVSENGHIGKKVFPPFKYLKREIFKEISDFSQIDRMPNIIHQTSSAKIKTQQRSISPRKYPAGIKRNMIPSLPLLSFSGNVSNQ